ncbi:MAG: winged helix-turn-helix domain-containing protein [Anaerolineales bacterium]|nr:MAG: winged helix-turn-helix domain-containing protein [Anaerolineales bacterium]
MSKNIQLAKQTAQRFILASQGLYPPRAWQGKRGAKSFLNQVRSIQFDPINVVGRNPDLVLQSRVRDFRPAMLDELLYTDRILVDNWDKMASLSLAEDWPYFSRHRERMKEMFGVPSEVVMSLAPTVLDQIRRQGPQCSLDYKFEEKTDWAWGPTRVTRASLEGLFKMGMLGVHHRVNNRRYFDLMENLQPAELLEMEDPNQSWEDYQRWHMLRRIGALGLAHPNGGEQWGGMIGIKTPQRRIILDELLDNGQVLAVEVEELPGDLFYFRREDKKILNRIMNEEPAREAAFIAPLDNLLWDRKTVNRIFDFSYMWEVYKPEAKREYGYYVLPVLYGDQLIARLDPEFDKKTRVLTVNNWWWEEGIQMDQNMAEALTRCMRDFLTYLDAGVIMYTNKLLKKGNLEWLGEV